VAWLFGGRDIHARWRDMALLLSWCLWVGSGGEKGWWWVCPGVVRAAASQCTHGGVSRALAMEREGGGSGGCAAAFLGGATSPRRWDGTAAVSVLRHSCWETFLR